MSDPEIIITLCLDPIKNVSLDFGPTLFLTFFMERIVLMVMVTGQSDSKDTCISIQDLPGHKLFFT